MNIPYITYSGAAGTSASRGWAIKEGGRSESSPKERETVIDDIPYRKDPIDLSKYNGKSYFGRRTVTYTFVQSFGSVRDAYEAASSFGSWLMECRGATLTDTLGNCAFSGAKCSSTSYSLSGFLVTFTAEFTANPYKTVNGVEVL